MTTREYEGTELGVFALAQRWKSYVRGVVAPYLVGDVIEVGAGIGTTTEALRSAAQTSWTCLEPDPALAAALSQRARGFVAPVTVRVGTLADHPERADCVLYVDVLEHIADDRAEVQRAVDALRPGGTVVTISPAHQWLFTPFDAAIGHHRRYNRRSLRALSPRGATLVDLRYLDAAGLLAVGGNRLLLRSASPTARQVLTWDRCLVPVSRVIDPLLRWRVGKSILAVWRTDARP